MRGWQTKIQLPSCIKNDLMSKIVHKYWISWKRITMNLSACEMHEGLRYMTSEMHEGLRYMTSEMHEGLRYMTSDYFFVIFKLSLLIGWTLGDMFFNISYRPLILAISYVKLFVLALFGWVI